ncbi:unnamed protein product [Prunus armeniaca]
MSPILSSFVISSIKQMDLFSSWLGLHFGIPLSSTSFRITTRKRGSDPETATELFNLRHASLRNVIERIFGIFKSRFTIFKLAPPFPYRTQAELVLACSGLHNFLRRECRSDEFPIEPENESSSSSPLLGNEGDNVEQVFETQEQQRENANEWRVGIASDMWRNAMQDNNGTQQ